MEKGALVATGNTAEIYEWGDQHVLKLFRPQYMQNVEYEANIAGIVNAAGIPSPAVLGIVRVEDRLGIVYTRVNGHTMVDYWLQNPLRRLLPLARQMAELQVTIHQTPPADGLPRQRARFIARIQQGSALSDATRQRVLTLLDQLPDGDTLCHGDFHLENILIGAQPPVVIDWIDATLGSALADVARTYMLISIGTKTAPASPRKLVNLLFVHVFLDRYLRRYCQITHHRRKDIFNWMPIVAAVRLDEGVAHQEKALRSLIES